MHEAGKPKEELEGRQAVLEQLHSDDKFRMLFLHVKNIDKHPMVISVMTKRACTRSLRSNNVSADVSPDMMSSDSEEELLAAAFASQATNLSLPSTDEVKVPVNGGFIPFMKQSANILPWFSIAVRSVVCLCEDIEIVLRVIGHEEYTRHIIIRADRPKYSVPLWRVPTNRNSHWSTTHLSKCGGVYPKEVLENLPSRRKTVLPTDGQGGGGIVIFPASEKYVGPERCFEPFAVLRGMIGAEKRLTLDAAGIKECINIMGAIPTENFQLAARTFHASHETIRNTPTHVHLSIFYSLPSECNYGFSSSSSDDEEEESHRSNIASTAKSFVSNLWGDVRKRKSGPKSYIELEELERVTSRV